MNTVKDPRRSKTLSAQELRVLQLIADGIPTEGIADRLEVTYHTVNAHVRNACLKLGATNRTHAVAQCLRSGAIT